MARDIPYIEILPKAIDGQAHHNKFSEGTAIFQYNDYILRFISSCVFQNNNVKTE